MAFFNGLDEELSFEYMAENFEKYVSFRDAARMIDEGWTANYLHKQKALGRLRMEQLMYILVPSMALTFPSTKGKKMFVHLDEVERFKREVYPTIKRQKRSNWLSLCPYCRKAIQLCRAEPCSGRTMFNIEQRRKGLVTNSESTLHIKLTPKK